MSNKYMNAKLTLILFFIIIIKLGASFMATAAYRKTDELIQIICSFIFDTHHMILLRTPRIIFEFTLYMWFILPKAFTECGHQKYVCQPKMQ